MAMTTTEIEKNLEGTQAARHVCHPASQGASGPAGREFFHGRRWGPCAG
jgi:hypothetical protein